jgi:hypothetical protein
MKRTRQWNWLRFGLFLTMLLILTACGGGGGSSAAPGGGGDPGGGGNPGGGGDPGGGGGGGVIIPPPPPAAAQASVVVGGRAGSATQLSSLIAASARAAGAMKAAAGDLPDPALAKAKVTLEVIKADGTSEKYYTCTDERGTYSLEADIIVGDVVTVTFEKDGFTTFSKTLDTTGTAANEKRQFVVNGKAAQTGIIVSTRTGDVFKAGGGTGSGFRFGLMRAGSGVQRAFASGNDVRRAATSGGKPELDINIPGSWAPTANALTAKLAAFDPANPTDRAFFPGDFVGIGGGAASAGAAASKAAADQTAYQLESVSFFSAEVTPNVGELVTPAQVSAARAAGTTKAAVPGNALIYKYIPVDGCTAIQKYADRDPATNGVQVPLYTYKSSTGKWGYLGEGTLAVYNAGAYDVANVADATTSLANLACGATDYYFAIETADWTTWWNLDYPILLEAPKTVTLCGTVVDKATGGNPVPGAYVVADGYVKGANSYHYAYAGNDGKFQLELLTGTGKTLDKFDFAAYDYSTWPSPSSKNAGGSFPTPPTDPSTTGCNQIGNVVVPSLNTGMIEGTILEELTATTTQPLAGQWVWVESLDSANYFYNWAQTDINGKFAMKAPLAQDLNVGILDKSYPTKINGVATGYEATDSNDKVTLTPIKQPNSPPVVSTWIDPNPAKAGKSVTLSAWAWDPEWNEPLTYQWTIDGANQSTLSEFAWTPATAGDVTVDVVVTDSKGKSTTTTQTLSVASAGNSLPVIYYTWAAPAASCGAAPTFYAYAYDPDGDPLTYTWKNAEGTVLAGTTDVNGGFVPNSAPSGDVLLTVSDGIGNVTETVPVPTASQLALYVAEAWPLTQTVNNSVELYAYAYSSAIEGVTYQWTVTAPDNSSVTPDPTSPGYLDWVTFTPNLIGNYAITLVASDGCSSETRNFTVPVEPADFVLDPVQLNGGQPIIVNQPVPLDLGILALPAGFTSELIDLTEAGTISNGTTLTPTWTPKNPGTHTLALSISYPGFPAVTRTLDVMVNLPEPTTGNITIQ